MASAGTLVFPEHNAKMLSSNPAEALASVVAESQLAVDPANFTLTETKESLLGTHYYFQHTVNGVAVENSQIVVSVNKESEIFKIYHSVEATSQKSLAPSIALVPEAKALELAWKHLQVNGELTARPEVKLVYNKNLRLVYKVGMSLSSPAGNFAVTVDAQNGNVLEVADAALPRMKREGDFKIVHLKSLPKFGTFSSALNSFNAAHAQKSFKLEAITVAGTAQVFDPNPVVILGRTDLQDESPASAFTQAYDIQDLKDITFSGSVYTLAGPKVKLIDFEYPNVAPSTSNDGHWVFERADASFTDTMTYLHIDRSVRYLETLGFAGAKAVFPRALEVDANGLNGDDNSHYIPYAKRLAFGHGCVDDNEDSEVILHELGHAINDHINPSWSGGDTGAMGEGFGDYWAASYTTSTNPNMRDEIMNWVFKWDGHNDCWPGRQLNQFAATYSASMIYGAHQRVNGGQSDEIWSTPIFQAYLELTKNRGVARADVDKIIIEAQYGLGSGLRMPDMARSIVKTAKKLFPNKDYDQVYTRHFQKQKIL
jgi:hypothetical protein